MSNSGCESCSCQYETEFWGVVSDETKASGTILYGIMIQEDKLMNLLEIKNLSKSFQKKKRVRSILNGLNVNFRGGEVAAIMGPSGCGKSTLLNILGGILAPDAGEILYNGSQINLENREETEKYRLNSIGYVLQDFALMGDRTVYQNVELPLKIRKIKDADRQKKIYEALKKVGMDTLDDSFAGTLSGGEQQRVAIARTMSYNPDIVLADEPTGALDEANSVMVMKLLRGMAAEGKIVIVVTHDAGVAKKCDVVYRLSEGQLIGQMGE